MKRFAVIFAFALTALAGGAPAQADQESPELARFREPVDQAINRGLEFLAEQQITREQARQMGKPHLEGSFASRRTGNTGVSSLAVMAYLAKGHTPGRGTYGDVINKGIDYILRMGENALDPATNKKRDLGGMILSLDNRSHGPMYAHSIASLLLCEVSGMVDPERQKKIDRVLPAAMSVLIKAHQHPKSGNNKGGWGYKPNANSCDLSLTGWATMAIRAGRINGCQIPAENIKQAVEYILRCRTSQGAFAYKPGQGPKHSMTGLALLCLELCGEHGNKVIKPAGDYLLKNKPKKLRDLGSGHAYYSWYYTAQGMFQIGGHHWEEWGKTMYPLFLAEQKEDGAWPSMGEDETYSTAMAILAMTVSYRQLPIYQRHD